MNLIADNFVTILLGLAVMWLFQFGLAYFQLRRFYGRLIQLKRGGLTAVGLSGGRYSGRSYAVLTINPEGRVIYAEQLSGWTVFAKLKPVPELVGMSLNEVLAQQTALPIPKKLQLAFANAARDLQTARQGEVEITPKPATA